MEENLLKVLQPEGWRLRRASQVDTRGLSPQGDLQCVKALREMSKKLEGAHSWGSTDGSCG